ncbi:MAG: bifunctional folylpolyglutamate synthase/dihydrofolate synthase [Xanthomonadales bacterium]|nr:bifunctional folylpolyglutamate synthase/dihydrofolate synthase [Xanthomonadales bacterium]
MKTLESWLELLEQRHPQEIELGLQRCGMVFERLGSPKPAKMVFTVAGTNGKGSTVAYLAAISGALGQRHGTYTSPHIFSFNERISIMGEAVSDESLINAFEQVESVRGDVSLTYFEFTTLAAFLIMQQAGLDCAVLEVGLGGRLDTVNLIDTDCALITPIGLDHQDYLGPDLSSIATEKAGIIRANTVVVCSEECPPEEIIQTAQSLSAPVLKRGVDFHLAEEAGALEKSLKFSMAGETITVPYPAMGGEHQLDNLAAALAAMAKQNPAYGLKEVEIGLAVRSCRLPGRLQIVGTAPEIILDVGHNQLAAMVVADYLNAGNRRKVTCVLAMLADKSVEDVVRALDECCSRWVCATSPGGRGQTAEKLAVRVQAALPAAEVNISSTLEDAMRDAIAAVGEDETILVFGSFTTVSAVANWLKNTMQRDSDDAARIT